MPAKASSVEIGPYEEALAGSTAPSWDLGSDSTCALAEEVKEKGDK